jgi:hypothetical protein
MGNLVLCSTIQLRLVLLIIVVRQHRKMCGVMPAVSIGSETGVDPKLVDMVKKKSFISVA